MNTSPKSNSDSKASDRGGVPNANAGSEGSQPSRTQGSPTAAVGIRRLTPSEIESLKREFKASGEWMAAMLRSDKIKDL